MLLRLAELLHRLALWLLLKSQECSIDAEQDLFDDIEWLEYCLQLEPSVCLDDDHTL